jgi:hypothetical protein
MLSDSLFEVVNDLSQAKDAYTTVYDAATVNELNEIIAKADALRAKLDAPPSATVGEPSKERTTESIIKYIGGMYYRVYCEMTTVGYPTAVELMAAAKAINTSQGHALTLEEIESAVGKAIFREYVNEQEALNGNDFEPGEEPLSLVGDHAEALERIEEMFNLPFCDCGGKACPGFRGL